MSIDQVCNLFSGEENIIPDGDSLNDRTPISSYNANNSKEDCTSAEKPKQLRWDKGKPIIENLENGELHERKDSYK